MHACFFSVGGEAHNMSTLVDFTRDVFEMQVTLELAGGGMVEQIHVGFDTK